MMKDRVEDIQGSSDCMSNFLLDSLVAKRKDELIAERKVREKRKHRLITQRKAREKTAQQPAWQFFRAIASIVLTAVVGVTLYFLRRSNQLILAGMAGTILFSEIMRRFNNRLNKFDETSEETIDQFQEYTKNPVTPAYQIRRNNSAPSLTCYLSDNTIIDSSSFSSSRCYMPKN